MEFVLHAGEAFGEDVDRLAGRAGLVRVEKVEDHVAEFRERAHHALEVVVAPGRLFGRVYHAGAVDERNLLQKRDRAELDAKRVQEFLPVLGEFAELRREPVERRLPAKLSALAAVHDYREAVVRRR